jgi:hypothetical protein
MIETYRDLRAWREALDLIDEIYDLTRAWPKEEQFGLTSQARRSAVSVPSVLAQGHARASTRIRALRFDRVGFPRRAGDAADHSARRGYTDQVRCDALLGRADGIGKMLRGPQKALDRKTARTA